MATEQFAPRIAEHGVETGVGVADDAFGVDQVNAFFERSKDVGLQLQMLFRQLAPGDVGGGTDHARGTSVWSVLRFDDQVEAAGVIAVSQPDFLSLAAPVAQDAAFDRG